MVSTRTRVRLERRVGSDAPGCFEPVHLGHADVHHDDVGIERAYLLERLRAGRGLADDLDVVARVKQRAEPGSDHGLVLGEHDPVGVIGGFGC